MTTPYSPCDFRSQERCSGDWSLYPFNVSCTWTDNACRARNCTAEELLGDTCGGVERGARIFGWALGLMLIAAVFLTVALKGCARLSKMKYDHAVREMTCGAALLVCAATCALTGVTLFAIAPTDNLLAVWVWQLGLFGTQFAWFVPVHVENLDAAARETLAAWRANVVRVYVVPCVLTYFFGFVCLTVVLFLQATPLAPAQNLWLFYPFCSWIVAKCARTETRVALVFYMFASVLAVRRDLAHVTTLVATQLCFVAFDVGVFELRLFQRTKSTQRDSAALKAERLRLYFCCVWVAEGVAALCLLVASLAGTPRPTLELSCVVVLCAYIVLLETRERSWPLQMPAVPAPPEIETASSRPSIGVVGAELRA